MYDVLMYDLEELIFDDICIYLSCSVKFAITLQEVLQKELEAANFARSSLEDSKRALEDELEEQKHTAALLQEQLQKEKLATNAETEAKDTLKERLEVVQSSATLLQTKLEEALAVETALGTKLEESKAAAAAAASADLAEKDQIPQMCTWCLHRADILISCLPETQLCNEVLKYWPYLIALHLVSVSTW